MKRSSDNIREGVDIAVIGMAGRFPGAENVNEYWNNLLNGVESIHFFSDEELLEVGISPDLVHNPRYVKAKGTLEGYEYFDSRFFGYSPREAKIMDPQIRIFHECVWEALEDAGCNVETYSDLIGLYAGASPNVPWEVMTFKAEAEEGILDNFTVAIKNNKDLMNTQVSYNMNFRGPSISLYSACSTSLVAIHEACQGLLSGDCDIALAGGVCVELPQTSGYLYEEGMIKSPDGHCRAFDGKANGTVYGSGVGVVVLKRIEDALRDKDNILAVIKGSAINNDGRRKVGYTAPSVDGQADVIKTAMQIAEVSPDDITYIETHGTGTKIGDVIEIEGLKKAFAESSRKGFCGIGSVKPNIGHLDAAAGIASFIKAVLIMKNGWIPPHINYQNPNSKIDFINSPFYINKEAKKLKSDKENIIGISSFGLGGANCHIILSEGIEVDDSMENREWDVLSFSAQTDTALMEMTKRFYKYLTENKDINMTDVSYTLQEGRKEFCYRHAIIFNNIESAKEQLAKLEKSAFSKANTDRKELIWLLPDENHIKQGFGAGLYDSNPKYGEIVKQGILTLCDFMNIRLTKQDIFYGTSQLDGELNDKVNKITYVIKLYGLSRILIDMNIIPSDILYQGAGKYVSFILQENMSLKEVIGQILLNEVEEDKFKVQMEEKVDYSNVLFLELGCKESFCKENLTLPENFNGVISIFSQNTCAELEEKQILEFIAALWENGVSIKWNSLYDNQVRNKVELPTYPFERKRYWIDKAPIGELTKVSGEENKEQIEKKLFAEWFYRPVWTQLSLKIQSQKGIKKEKFIIFAEDNKMGNNLVKSMQDDGYEVITVYAKKSYSKLDNTHFAINAESESDYIQLLRDIKKNGEIPLAILHTWLMETEGTAENWLMKGYYSVIYLAKAISKIGIYKKLKITVASSDMHNITGNEETIPEKMLVLAVAKVLPQEYQSISCNSVDFTKQDMLDFEKVMRNLKNELWSNSNQQIVAYRETNRVVKSYEKISEEELHLDSNGDVNVKETKLVKNGVYVITGGLGEIGMRFADFLAKFYSAKIVLISRNGLPNREEWEQYIEKESDNNTSLRIRKVMELEDAGAEILIQTADVSDAQQMKHVLEVTESKFGKINGVIHAAGIIRVKSGQTPIEKISMEDCEEQFIPKMYGTRVLWDVLLQRDIDFCLLISSLAPILGGLGHVAYAAANLYMDAFVEKMYGEDKNCNWICVNWAEWQTELKIEQKYNVGEGLEKLELTPEEGVKVLQQVLHNIVMNRVVVSTGDLQSRFEQWITLNQVQEDEKQSSSKVKHYENMSTASSLETIISDIWKEYYDVDSVDIDDKFFEMGATSLDFIHLNARLGKTLERHIPLEVLFEYPTIKLLAAHLAGGEEENLDELEYKTPNTSYQDRDIAIIGVSGQYPRARNITEYWSNLVAGKEGITFFTENELKEAGISQEELNDPNYIRAKGYLPDAEYFDEGFFHYSASDAEMLDPQMRVFMECVWNVLEDGGYNPSSYKGSIGLFAGATPNLYWEVMAQLSKNHNSASQFESSLLYDKDGLTTQISYKLNLKGPSTAIFTGCSTSLVAIDYACQSLLSGNCDMAVAGGVTITLPMKCGYHYEEGMIFSKDGHTRSFDEQATGSVFSDGAGAVLLKPYKNAVEDGDNIYAIIKGTAVNNDGSRKVGYTSPSINGQAEVIRKAQKNAGVKPEDITYIETHGTATRLGDPIEIKALTKAFRSEKKGYCRIGTVKSNLGHTMCASGVAGVIKTALSLKNKVIPPTLFYQTGNSEIDFENSPFVVNTELTKWESNGAPLRAGVSAFGIGGTNAHAILEEAPAIQSSTRKRHWKMLLLSARSNAALDKMSENLLAYLQSNQDVKLEDIAYTLQVGRKRFHYCRTIVCDEMSDAVECLTNNNQSRVRNEVVKEDKRGLVFMFAGQGSQYVNMGEELYRMESVFREAVDQCAKILKPLMNLEIRQVMYPAKEVEEDSKVKINKTEITQPVLFVFEYALAKLIMSWGLCPSAMIGYSFGEYVAAQLAGVISLEDVLKLIVSRGKLMQTLQEGAMLSVPIPEDKLSKLLRKFMDEREEKEILSIGIINGPSCIVSGSKKAVDDFQSYLKKKRYFSVPINISYGVHSEQMKPITSEICNIIRKMKLSNPKIPYISGLTGTWIKDEEAISPEYWARHLMECIHFSDGINQLLEEKETIFVEIGPGRDLSVLLNRFMEDDMDRIVNLVKPEDSNKSDLYFLLTKVAHLWANGIEIDWNGFYADEKRRRVSLPTYPFERNRYWIEGNPMSIVKEQGKIQDKAKRYDIKNWFYRVQWKQADFDVVQRENENTKWLLFMDNNFIAEQLSHMLRNQKLEIILVTKGQNYVQVKENEFVINPYLEADYEKLLNILVETKQLPDRIVHCFGIELYQLETESKEKYQEIQNNSLYSLIKLMKAFGSKTDKCMELTVVTNDLYDITGAEKLNSAISTVLGAVAVIPQEYPQMKAKVIDIVLYENKNKVVAQIYQELMSEFRENIVALRGGHRWIRDYKQLELDENDERQKLKKAGVYLITGGLGGIGFILSKYLSKEYHANLILIGRTELPERDKWDEWIENHDQNDVVSKKIEKIKTIESSGGKVITCCANVSDEESMTKAITAGEEAFGPINGVIYCAGLLDGNSFNIIRDIKNEDCELQFEAKAYGLIVLENALKDKTLDFCLIMSSIASILGGLGFIAYSAANNYIDHFVEKHNRKNSNTMWISVDWSEWRYQKTITTGFGNSIEEYGMDEPEAVKAFERILNSEINGYVAHSPGSLQTRMDEWVYGKNNQDAEVEETNFENFHERSASLTSDYVIPQTETEKKVEIIWEVLFRTKDIGVLDDFFELGGDSLKALNVITRIHKEFNIEISVTEFLQNATIRKIAAYIDKSVSSEYRVINAVEKKQYYPVSHAQESVYIIRQLEGDQVSYNTPVAIIIEGNLNVEKLEACFKQLIVRHESLRTSFKFIDGKLVQYVHDEVDFTLEYDDILKEELKSDNDMLVQIVREFIKPFDLDKAPLIRGKLLRIEDNKNLLMYDLHHIISDGVSANIVVKELIKLYQGEELEELKLQYRDFSEWQNELYQSQAFEKQEKYWLSKLSGELPLLNVPTDYPRPYTRNFNGDSLKFEVDEELTEKLNEIASANKTTLYTVLLATYNILLSKYSGQNDILVGLSMAGRTSVELENIIGMFINTVVMRNFPSGEKTFLQFLEEVKTTAFEAYENQDYPFDSLVEILKIKRDPSRSPIFDTMFTLQNLEVGETDVEGLKIIPFDFQMPIAKFDLNMNAWEVDGKIQFIMEYSTSLFRNETIQIMCERYIGIMKEVVENWNILISQIENNSDEKKNIVLDFNDDLEDE